MRWTEKYYTLLSDSVSNWIKMEFRNWTKILCHLFRRTSSSIFKRLHWDNAKNWALIRLTIALGKRGHPDNLFLHENMMWILIAALPWGTCNVYPQHILTQEYQYFLVEKKALYLELWLIIFKKNTRVQSSNFPVSIILEHFESDFDLEVAGLPCSFDMYKLVWHSISVKQFILLKITSRYI